MINSRREKAMRIVGLYKRNYTQQRIADELGIPQYRVGQILREHGFYHTKKVERGNLSPGQKINPIQDYNKLAFLDNYEF